MSAVPCLDPDASPLAPEKRKRSYSQTRSGANRIKMAFAGPRQRTYATCLRQTERDLGNLAYRRYQAGWLELGATRTIFLRSMDPSTFRGRLSALELTGRLVVADGRILFPDWHQANVSQAELDAYRAHDNALAAARGRKSRAASPREPFALEEGENPMIADDYETVTRLQKTLGAAQRSPAAQDPPHPAHASERQACSAASSPSLSPPAPAAPSDPSLSSAGSLGSATSSLAADFSESLRAAGAAPTPPKDGEEEDVGRQGALEEAGWKEPAQEDGEDYFAWRVRVIADRKKHGSRWNSTPPPKPKGYTAAASEAGSLAVNLPELLAPEKSQDPLLEPDLVFFTPTQSRLTPGELRRAIPPEWGADVRMLAPYAGSESLVARAVETTRAAKRVNDRAKFLYGTLRNMALGIPKPERRIR